MHCPQSLHLQRDAPAMEECFGIGQSPKCRTHESQLADSIMDKNGGRMMKERIPS